MSGRNKSFFGRLSDEHRREAKQLDAACKRHWGVSAWMFRVFKFLFYILTLVFTGYLIQIAEVEPTLAMAFAALLITGPEGVEALTRRD